MKTYVYNMAAEQNIVDSGIERNLENGRKPQRILLFSGKRKSGKDFITNILHERLGEEESVIIKLSGPIKTHWAKSHELDIDKLLGDGAYKEKYRHEMNKWGEAIRNEDYGYFCRAAINMYNAHSKPIWIISDARRKTDVQWFKENFGDLCKTIRISCDDSVRENRGWVFVPGIDDADTECNLDDATSWDLRVENDNEDIDLILQKILALVR